MSDTTPRHDDHPVDPTASFEPVTDAEHTEVVPELPAPEHTEFVPAAPAPAPVAPSAHDAQPLSQAQPQSYAQTQDAQQPPPAAGPGYAVAPAPILRRTAFMVVAKMRPSISSALLRFGRRAEMTRNSESRRGSA